MEGFEPKIGVRAGGSTEEIAEYLAGYTVFRRMLRINEYEEEYFGNADSEADYLSESEKDALPGSEAYLRARMFEIRRFIMSLGKCSEKIFLFYYYIHGESVEKCGELMGISRRSAFRLKKRALEYAALKYGIYRERLYRGVR